MSLIKVVDLTFAYENSPDYIFDHVSFQLDTSWKLGFTGRNGRGKTTFLNLLAGKLQHQGQISANVTFDYFPYSVPNPHIDTLSVVDSVIKDYEYWQLNRELTLLQLSDQVLYRPFSSLSNGEQTKVLLAALFLRENSFLLIDEPTNHLDIDGRDAVSQYLKGKPGFILVSHDRSFLDNCIDHILSINKADIVVQKGNFSSWWHNKELKDNYELTKNQKLQRQIKIMETAARRTSKWSSQIEKTKNGQKVSGVKPDKGHIGAQAAKMMKRSKSIEGRQQAAIEEKGGLLKNIESADTLKIYSLEFKSDPLVYLEDLSLHYEENCVCSHINFAICRGDRIAIHGKNGSGKSSIIKLICGDSIQYHGILRVGTNLKISYVSQDTSSLSGTLSQYAQEYAIDETQLKTILRKFGFTRIQFEKNMEDFSGGQKKKVLIARSLCEKAHLYIWDEPLNYIDVLSRMQIEQLLEQYQPTMLFVEHDRAFLDRIATKVISI